MKLAICITTTPNRSSVMNQTMVNWMHVAPQGCFLYVHNDVNYDGVSKAKNKCLEWSEFADFVFCFDDDIWPVDTRWAERYVNSGLEHAAYTFDRRLIHSAPQYNEFEKPNGCMMFFTRKCIDVVGGWDTDFKGYGYEHVNLSDRIYNMGLTPGRYIDIPNSRGLFEMADCESSFTSGDRMHIPANEKLYQQKYYSKEFKPFK
jgi:hypothetical protein